MNAGEAEEIERLKNEVSRLRTSLNVLVKALVENSTLDPAVAGPITRLLRTPDSEPPAPRPVDPRNAGSNPYRGPQPDDSSGEHETAKELCARCGIPLSGDDTHVYVRDVGTVCTGCYRSHDGR